MTNSLIAIVGPTAIGKTTLSIQIAKHLNSEIISADSRQFYKEMSIGTAVPSQSELNIVKHHFIHHKSIKEDYNVGQFERDSIEKLDDLFQRHSKVVMVGGSGLYVNAVINGLDDFPDIDPSLRLRLTQRLNEDGIEALQKQLKVLDPQSYATIAIDNPHRLIRALEISIGSGHPYSSFLKQNNVQRNFKTILIGLTADRNVIYDRINNRVDKMIDDGLVEEAKELHPYRDLNALNTVGYKELFSHFDGDISLDTAISEIKKNTRRFAKRQLTWFRKQEEIKWFDINNSIETIIAFIESCKY